MGAPKGYRLRDEDLLATLDNWDSLMNFRVRLIACGGTALTLLKMKDSTRDIDFTVPMQKEYDRLMKFLGDLGYEEKGGGLAHDDDPNFI
jgi:predicted nucleotidyltransferase component of viral defense system